MRKKEIMESNDNHNLFDKNFTFDYSSCTTYSRPSCDNSKYGSIFSYNNNYTYLNYKDSEEPLISRATRYIISLLCYIIAISTFPISFIFCLKKVPALERLVIFRLGKIQKVKGPGYVIVLPCVDHFIRVDLRPQFFIIPKTQFLTRDGAILELEVRFSYQLIDVIQSVLQVNNLNEIVKSLAKQCLTNSISSKDQSDVEKDPTLIDYEIRELMNKSTISWGFEITKADIGSIFVIKAAESSTAMSSLVSSLKSAMGLSSDTEKELESQPSTSNLIGSYGDRPSETPMKNPIVLKLHQKVNEASSRRLLNDVKGILKLSIENFGNLFIVIEDGQGEVIESCYDVADVTISLSMESLNNLIEGIETPYRAYSEGTVKVNGDYSLLLSFAAKLTSFRDRSESSMINL